MFARLREWRAERTRKRLEKYADRIAFMDRNELDRLRKQQSPLRGGRGRRG